MYVKGLKLQIQDKMNTHYLWTIYEAHKISLKLKEKLIRKWQQNCRGKGPRGRGRESDAKGYQKEDEYASNQNGRGRSSMGRGEGFGRGKSV